MSKHARLKGESIREWLDRVSIPSSTWFKKAKRRQRYKKLYRNMYFYILLKYTMLKSIIIKKLK
mgnify:CR=1 FL=1